MSCGPYLVSETFQKHVPAKILSLRLILCELIIKVFSHLAVSRVVFVTSIKVNIFGLPDHVDLVEVVNVRIKREVVVASDLLTG